MKKTIALCMAVLCCFSVLLFPVSATDVNTTTEEIFVSSSRIELPDGGYIIETVKKIETPTVARTTYNTSGTKTTVRYTASGTAVYGVEVYGTFSYTGSSSWATSSTATVYTYHKNASYVSKSASYSGATAYATGTVKYLTVTESRTAALSCDKNGNLS